MQERGNVMVFIEHRDGLPAEVSLELMSQARELAHILGVGVEAAALGSGQGYDKESLGRYGCGRVFDVQHPGLKEFTSVPYAKALTQVIRNHEPQIVLFGATTTGRDVAPRVASELQCGLTADCTDLQIGEYKVKGQVYENVLLQIRPAFGGNIVATIVSPESLPSMATVREGVMPKREMDSWQPTQVVHEDVQFSETDFPTQVLEIERKEKGVDLKKAKIIVSAGMGASDPQSLELVYETARVLGGVVGASRPVVDAGIVPKEHQVGQTGTTVRPNLYIACGISGQIQHRAGMIEAKRIIAINSDPQAPIFDIAHYGIVGDVKQVLQQMIKSYKDKA
ncbi:MAG: electron transfer flavoprotein subunit alpha/FixB family protein [Desulfovermiculus sp.]|nr:electron transfer flavoprotein subunit alpha/FixB family protein [Desulfovermiculus sp.]